MRFYGPDECYGQDDSGPCEHCGRSIDNYCDCERCDRCGYVIDGDCECARCETDGCGILLDEGNTTGHCPDHQEPEEITPPALLANNVVVRALLQCARFADVAEFCLARLTRRNRKARS